MHGPSTLAAVLFTPLVLAACHRGERPGGSPPAASRTAPARPAIDLTPGEPEKGGHFGSDRLWRRARAGEPHDLAALARREGALGLLEGLEVGRSVALTALAALPHAEDAELALERLCELLEERDGDPREPILLCVHAIVAEPPPQAEELDNSGYIGCLSVMRKLARPGVLEGTHHDLAESSVELIEEHRDAAKH